MFANGVEIINYKSPQQIHYGEVKKVDVLNQGSGYDILTPPSISINSKFGTGAKINLSLDGKVEKIRIDNTGFDFLEEPIISLKGGNGSGCKLKSRLLPIIHQIEFDAGTTGYVSSGSTISIINTVENSFRIESQHKFRDADEVVYRTNGNNGFQLVEYQLLQDLPPALILLDFQHL